MTLTIKELHDIRESHSFDIFVIINGEYYELKKCGGLFYDYNNDELLTGAKLESEFEQLKAKGETACETFNDYLESIDCSVLPVKWG